MNKNLKRVYLTGQDIRHLLDLLLFEESGRWDKETDKWTYPQIIRRKLAKKV